MMSVFDVLVDIWETRKNGTPSQAGRSTPTNVLTGFYRTPTDASGTVHPYQSTTSATAVGDHAAADGKNTCAVGAFSESSDNTTTAVGPSARATIQASVAVGEQAGALKYGSTVVGRKSVSNGNNGVIVGHDNGITHENVTILGNGIFSTGDNQIRLGSGSQTILMSLTGSDIGTPNPGSITTGGDIYLVDAPVNAHVLGLSLFASGANIFSQKTGTAATTFPLRFFAFARQLMELDAADDPNQTGLLIAHDGTLKRVKTYDIGLSRKGLYVDG